MPWSSLALVLILVVVNAVLSGSEIALISLRESQVAQMARRGGAGAVTARLARDPNRFLATIQIGITLAGFLASAVAAITLAEPLIPYLGWFGSSADTMAVVLVTLALSFLTLVLGELAPKRLALQRPESWALAIGRPLHAFAVLTRPIVWLLGVTTDLVVRLFGGRPGAVREEIDLEELREMVIANRALREDHQEVLLGAFEVAERTVGDVMTPRPAVVTIEADLPAAAAARDLAASGHGRAPVIPSGGGLDDTVGVVSLGDLIAADPDATAASVAIDPVVFPGTVLVIAALRRLQEAHQQLALVVDEHGGIDGVVTVEDLVEELVGEIYDESDRDVVAVRRSPDGTLVVPGRFPIHDLVDLGVTVPEGEYRTVAGLVLDALGRVPMAGDRVEVADWEISVLTVFGRTVGRARFRRL